VENNTQYIRRYVAKAQPVAPHHIAAAGEVQRQPLTQTAANVALLKGCCCELSQPHPKTCGGEILLHATQFLLCASTGARTHTQHQWQSSPADTPTTHSIMQ
jgi:hypothetical protein